MVTLKDTNAAEAIKLRGGDGSQIRQIAEMRHKTVGEIANLAAGDSVAETALKIIKQAGKKAQKFGGK